MSIVLEHLTKHYERHPVVNKVSLEVANGEFFVLLGPSGSGKSTVLRMIAGLTPVDGGRALLHGRDVTHLLPQQREVGFVFQHYALFRHMTVADNVEFALRIRKAAAAERRRRRDELLELVGLSGLGSRMPHQLSGGQQQRVALARALAHQPAVLLLDEPFGALDAKIRVDLRRMLSRVQRETGTTTIFVTHDQEEAFELADRLGVMNAGRLLEVGPPDELYRRPQTEFVATFLGTANLLLGEVVDDGVRLGPLRLPLGTTPAQGGTVRRVQVLIRPEDAALARSADELDAPGLGQGVVDHITFGGSFERLRLRLPALPGVRSLAPPPPFGSSDIAIEALRSQDLAASVPLGIGDRVWVGVRRFHALTHPGLRLLLAVDGTPDTAAVLEVGGAIARLSHARTTVLAFGSSSEQHEHVLQAAKENIGAGLPTLETISSDGPVTFAVANEVTRQPYDLLVLGGPPQAASEVAEQELQTGEHHILLAPPSSRTPSRMLVCVASGEPSKDDVLVAGRLARHLGAEITLLTIAAGDQDAERSEQFMAAATRAFQSQGVAARSLVRRGTVRDEIMKEMASGDHDMLVVGAPLSGRDGRAGLAGVVGSIVAAATSYPVLIVRSSYSGGRQPWIGPNGRISLSEEIVR